MDGQRHLLLLRPVQQHNDITPLRRDVVVLRSNRMRRFGLTHPSELDGGVRECAQQIAKRHRRRPTSGASRRR
jgi:hypothetical protein